MDRFEVIAYAQSGCREAIGELHEVHIKIHRSIMALEKLVDTLEKMRHEDDEEGLPRLGEIVFREETENGE